MLALELIGKEGGDLGAGIAPTRCIPTSVHFVPPIFLHDVPARRRSNLGWNPSHLARRVLTQELAMCCHGGAARAPISQFAATGQGPTFAWLVELPLVSASPRTSTGACAGGGARQAGSN